jgi:hypothetical protein
MSNLHCNKSICSSFHSSNASSPQSQTATACPQMSIASARVKKSPATLPIACLPTAPCKKALVCAVYHPVCLSTERLLCRPKIPPVCNLISAIFQTILRQPKLYSTHPSSTQLPSSSLCFALSAKPYQKESLGTTWLSWRLWRSLPYLSVSSSIVSIHISNLSSAVAYSALVAAKGFGEHLWNLQDKKLSPILFERKSFVYNLRIIFDMNSLHFMVHLHCCSLYDQSLARPVLPANLPVPPFPKDSLHCARFHRHQLRCHFLGGNAPMPTIGRILESRYQGRQMPQHTGGRVRQLSMRARTGHHPLDTTPSIPPQFANEKVSQDCCRSHVHRRNVWRGCNHHALTLVVDLQDLHRSHMGLRGRHQVESTGAGSRHRLSVHTIYPSHRRHDHPSQPQGEVAHEHFGENIRQIEFKIRTQVQ